MPDVALSIWCVDALLADAGWNLTDGAGVLFEHALPDGSRADYVLCDRAGRPMAVIEAKRASVEPIAAQDQGRHYAELLGVPFVFLSNGDEVRFLDRDADAHAREVATFYSQEDLERRIAAQAIRRALVDVPIDRQIVDRGYQIDCIETLSDEVTQALPEPGQDHRFHWSARLGCPLGTWRGVDGAGGQAGQVTTCVGVRRTGASSIPSNRPSSRSVICLSNVCRETAYIPPRAPSNPQFHAASA